MIYKSFFINIPIILLLILCTYTFFATPKINSYKITTYNVFWGISNLSVLPSYIAYDLKNNMFYKEVDTKINLLANELKFLDSDIYFFQEIYDINFLNKLNEKLDYKYFPLIQLYNLSSTVKLPLHTACLYKKHLDIKIIDNHFTNNFGRLIHIYDKDANINFINIHLISSIENYEIRYKQLESIIHYSTNFDNVILLGDFNDFDSKYYYINNRTNNTDYSTLDILAKNNFINAFSFYNFINNESNIYTHYTGKKNKFVDFSKLQTLDYIYYKNKLFFFNINITLLNNLQNNTIINNLWLSDHRALTVYFEYK
jgi:endonuclease/exonuclease/phosphatase family metal-dependent hydrolase